MTSESEEKVIIYNASETGKKFHRSKAKVICAIGPVGSGKSVMCANHIMYLANKQGVSSDFKKYTRVVVVRNTYSELKLTTMKTWCEWFPEEYYGKISKVAPFMQKIEINDLVIEVIFLALDREKDVKKLLSLECNIIWFNEAREIPWVLVSRATERIGRFNKCVNGEENIRQIIMDTNPPHDEHWIYKVFEEERPEGFEIFHQPPGLIKDESGNYIQNPDADNYENLCKMGLSDYYTSMVNGKTEEEVKVYALGEYGATFDGKPVHPQYNDSIHYAGKEIETLDKELVISLDFGLTPAVTFIQMTDRGKVHVIDEIIGNDIDIRAFCSDILVPHIIKNYSGLQVRGFGDPAGNQRAQTDSSMCIDICNQILRPHGIYVEPAYTNVLAKRLDSINQFLGKLVDGEPAFQLSSKAKTVRKGFLGGYHYKKVHTVGSAAYKEEPNKNEYSHPMDALQYGMMYFAGNVDKAKNISNTSSSKLFNTSNTGWMGR